MCTRLLHKKQKKMRKKRKRRVRKKVLVVVPRPTLSFSLSFSLSLSLSLSEGLMQGLMQAVGRAWGSWSPSAALHFSSTFNMIDQRMERQRSRASSERSLHLFHSTSLPFLSWLNLNSNELDVSKAGGKTNKKSLLFPFSHPHSALLHYITFNFLLLLFF